MNLDILYEDNHLLVINKPAGLATMGAEPGEPTLLEYARSYIKDKYKKPGKVYFGIVSRLDAFVSGVILLARTSKSAGRLTDQFAKRTASKTYWAIVTPPQGLEGTFVDWVVKDDAARRMQTVGNADATVPPVARAKLAKLSFEQLGQHVDQQLVQVHLETGRKHQIRLQFASRGSPVIGDRKYGSPVGFKTGIGLHSYQLVINHPVKKQEMVFGSPVPDYWKIERFGLETTARPSGSN